MFEVRWGLLDFAKNKQAFIFFTSAPQVFLCAALRTSSSDADERRRLWMDICLACFNLACVQYPNVIELWELRWRIKKNLPRYQKKVAEECFLLKIKRENLCWHEVQYPQTLNPAPYNIKSFKTPKGRVRNI